MAKVIHTILNLKDNMSKGLLNAAKNTEGVSKEMRDATRDVIKFGSKAGQAIKGFASSAAKAFAGTATAATGAFLAMGSLTEEYRAEQAKLNSAFETAGYSAEIAAGAYRDLYKIIGDTGTATEASQLLAELTQNAQDVSTWIDIVAGNYGKWGTAIDGAGLLESINETQKSGTITGALADSINWLFDETQTFGVALRENTEANEEWNEAVKAAETSEDFFNLALQQCSSEAERNKLIMDTLSGAYGDAASSFYDSNSAISSSRQNFLIMADVTAKLGDASANTQNKLWALFGAQEDGSARAGSALDFLFTKTDEFTNWVNSLDLSSLQTEFDAKFAVAVEKGAAAIDKCVEAFNWLKDNSDTVVTALKVLGGVLIGSKILKFTADTASSIRTLGLFGKTLFTISKSNIPKLATALKNVGSTATNNALLNGVWIKNQAVKAGGALGNFGKSAVSTGKNVATGVGSGITKAGGAIASFGKSAVAGGKTVAKGLGSNIAKAGGAIGQFSKSTVSNAGKTVATFGKSAVSAGKTMATGLGGGIAGVAGKLASFGKLALGFVSSNPIVLIIAAVIAAGVLLYKNWDKVKAFAIGLWDKVKEVFGGIKDAIVGAFDYAKDKVSGFFSWIDKKIESIPILGDLYGGAKGAVGWLADKIGFNAMGTNYWTGGLTYVHERGGEIIDLPSGTRIIPHDISLNMAKDLTSQFKNRTVSAANLQKVSSAPNVSVNIYVQGNVIGNKQYADELGEQVAGKILKKIENIA